MSLLFVSQGYEFKACRFCESQPGAVRLCAPCLERRELLGVVQRVNEIIDGAQKMGGAADRIALGQISHRLRLCPHCAEGPNVECPEHGR
jgi:hypothetical protein